MESIYVRRSKHEPALTASIALLLDAPHVRRCAARSHEIASGSRVAASQISLDASQISSFLDRFVVEFELTAAADTDHGRPGRRIYDTVAADRRQRWRQPHYRSVTNAERFVVTTVRAPRPPRNGSSVAVPREHSTGVETALASDLVRLAAGEITTVVLLARSRQCATAAWTARELGASVVLLIPAGCRALVAEALREAATRVIGLHEEVFAALFDVREPRSTRRSRRTRAPAPTSSRQASSRP